MAIVFENVRLSSLSDQGDIAQQTQNVLKLQVSTQDAKPIFSLYNGNQQVLTFDLGTENSSTICRATKLAYMVNIKGNGILLHFTSEFEVTRFEKILDGAKYNQKQADKKSLFSQRTDEASAVQYFQFYGYLSQQQNMMQDYIRTSTYQKAMLTNHEDFKDKVVLDVGAGSGILSFFAIQAGARKVYAIEASSIAEQAKQLVKANNLANRITVVPGKVEEVTIPEQVDLIVSEPMGYMLFNERMLESFLHAKKWLKPGGKMFPTQGDVHIAPFTDDALYMEQFTKANFWYQQSFHGVDLTCLRETALQEFLRQPIVDTFDIKICLARTYKYTVDFLTTSESDLHRIEIPLQFKTHQSGAVHGLAFWFDVAFHGSLQSVWLSTAPTEPLTHWYQVRCLLRSPIYVTKGQRLTGKVILIANARQSYDIDLELESPGSEVKSTNRLDLKNPLFHYTGQQVLQGGTHTSSPSESYWSQLGNGTAMDATGSTLGNGYSNGQGLSTGVVQSIPIGKQANTDPIAHSTVLPGGLTQRQYTVAIPSSVGQAMSTLCFTNNQSSGQYQQQQQQQVQQSQTQQLQQGRMAHGSSSGRGHMMMDQMGGMYGGAQQQRHNKYGTQMN
ncbi:histone-arginine methyltransferase CARMER-like isoform X1 [Lytechinus variegatus]|uniref:histone-arginine methyltransferase CARMER-like isoform X1 n=1 Tax=Lytechinus variegatus TaxID=7654 RepID=UPI001BB2C9C7|nr:histone-arginine methyltransferase CARMER-like isoform X1 [Lytechinus variegatus]